MSCTAAHLRSRSLNIESLSDMMEGSYRSWDLYTTGQLVDGLQQKKKKKKKERKPVFLKRKWNHVFSRTTILSFHPVDYPITAKFSNWSRVLSLINETLTVFWLGQLLKSFKIIYTAS